MHNPLPELQSMTAYLLPHLAKTGNHNPPPRPSVTPSPHPGPAHRPTEEQRADCAFPLPAAVLVFSSQSKRLLWSKYISIETGRDRTDETSRLSAYFIQRVLGLCGDLGARVASDPDTRGSLKEERCQGQRICVSGGIQTFIQQICWNVRFDCSEILSPPAEESEGSRCPCKM